MDNIFFEIGTYYMANIEAVSADIRNPEKKRRRRREEEKCREEREEWIIRGNAHGTGGFFLPLSVPFSVTPSTTIR